MPLSVSAASFPSGGGRPLLLALLLTLMTASPTLAEGSRDLLGSGPADYRASMETGYGGGTTSNIPRKTTLYAYAKLGEQIALGNSGMGVGATAINVYTYTGATTVAAFTSATCGLIQNRAQEAIGPVTAYPNGYTPCLYVVPASGIYRIEMLAPANTNANPPTRLVSAGWGAVGAGEATLAAWDVSVLSAAKAEQKGRVFARYMSLNVGGNTLNINLRVYAQTRDGYLYKVQQFLDPYGYIFFANNKGIKLANGNPSYASALNANTSFNSPVAADSATDFTAKLFLNPPDPTLPASSDGDWLLPTGATLPPTPTGLTFTGVDGTAGYAGSSGGYVTGGTFTFTNPGSTPFAYRLTIPLSNNTSGTNTDRVLLGTAASGSTSVTWDGLDGSGNPVASGSTGYVASVKLFGGEIHFPLLDVENSSGLTITRQNLAGSGDGDPSLVYWDDRPLPQVRGPSNPTNTPKGVSSATPTHVYGDGSGAGFGDTQTIDTYAYYPSSPASNGSGLTVRSADIVILKQAVSSGAPKGRATNYTLTVRNASVTPGPVVVTVSDPLPSWGTAISYTCASGCTPASGSSATGVSTSVTLTGTASVVIKVAVTGSAATATGTTVVNTGTVSRANDATDPDATNNTSSVSLLTRDAVTLMTVLKEQRNVTTGTAFAAGGITVRPGDQVQYRLTFTAGGDRTFTAATLRDPLPAQLTPVGNATLTCPNGVTASTAAGQNISINLTATCGTLNVGDTGTVLINAAVR